MPARAWEFKSPPGHMSLLNKKCISCQKNPIKPFSKEKIEEYLDFAPGWFLSLDRPSDLGHSGKDSSIKIHKEFLFKDFVQAIRFTNRVADIAEVEGHHPDIYIFNNKVKLELWTHSINGLSENDFILAAKIDDMLFLLGK